MVECLCGLQYVSSYRLTNSDQKGKPQKLGCAWAPTPCGRGVGPRWPPWQIHRPTPIPTCVILPNLLVLGQTIRMLLKRSSWKMTHCVPPFNFQSHLTWLKVIWTDIDLSAMHLQYKVPLQQWASRTVWEINGDFESKIAKFSTLCVFNAPLKGFPLELGMRSGSWN